MDLSALTLGPCTVPGIQQLQGSSHYKGSAAETGRGNVANDSPPPPPRLQTNTNKYANVGSNQLFLLSNSISATQEVNLYKLWQNMTCK